MLNLKRPLTQDPIGFASVGRRSTDARNSSHQAEGRRSMEGGGVIDGAHGTEIVRWRATTDDEWQAATDLPANLVQSCQAALDRAGASVMESVAARPLGETGRWEIAVVDGFGERGELLTRKVIA